MHFGSLVTEMTRTLLMVLVTGLAVYGQDNGFTLRVEVPVVSVDVSVTDDDGRPVAGLAPDDFEIRENGIPQSIEYFGPSTTPYHTYILVDVSGSTENQWDFMRRAISRFVATLAPWDRISIGVFGQTLTTLSPWNPPGSQSLSALAPILELEPLGGTTELYRSLEDVVDDAFDGITERKAIVVLTDGRDSSLYLELAQQNRLREMEDDRQFRSAYRRVAESGVTVFFVAVNTDQNLESDNGGADEYRNLGIIFGDSPWPERYLEAVRLRMERLAEVSGGQVFFPRSIADVETPFGEIASALNEAYSLGYAPERRDGDPLRRIEVRVPGSPYEIRQSRTEYRFIPE